MNNLTKFLVKNGNAYSFMGGIMVTGYCVEIVSNTESNIWHYGSVISGVLCGIFLFYLYKISDFITRHALAEEKAEIPLSKDSSYIDKTWRILDNTNWKINFLWIKKTTKIYYVSAVLAIFFFILCVIFFIKGSNRDVSEECPLSKEIQQSEIEFKINQLTKNQQILIQKIDALKINSESMPFIPQIGDSIPPPKMNAQPKNSSIPSPSAPKKIDSSKDDTTNKIN